jgi:hypothetical protein
MRISLTLLLHTKKHYVSACNFTWPSADMVDSIEVQSLGTIHQDERVSRALIVQVAVRLVWMVVRVDLQRILIGEGSAVWLTRGEGKINQRCCEN